MKARVVVLAAVCGPRVGSWGTPKLASVPGDCLLRNLGSRSAGLQPSLLVDHALPLSAGYRGRFGHQRLLPKLEAPPPAWRDTRGNEAEPPPLGRAGGRGGGAADQGSRRRGACPGDQEASTENAALERSVGEERSKSPATSAPDVRLAVG